MKANEKDMLLWDFVEKSRLNPSRKLPAALKSTYDEKVSELIHQKDALNSPEGQAYLKMLVKATNTMPDELMAQLQAMTQGTFQEAMTAINFYNEVTTGINGDVQSGKIIQQSIDSGDAALMDTATTFAADVVRRNSGNDKAAEEQWRRGMLELAKPENNVQFFADQYYTATKVLGSGTSLDTAIGDAFRSHYGRLSVDPSILKEAREAYRNTMILSGDVDPTVALDKVMERIFNRYTASPIYYRGIAPSEPLENPDIDGYRSDVKLGPHGVSLRTDPNQWTSDFVTGQLHNFIDSGQIAMSPEGLRALDGALVATDAVPLGKTIFLEPLAGDRARTQFKVLVSVENGASTEVVMVTGEDGRPTPLLLDPGLILSNINSRDNISSEIEKDEAAFEATRNRDIIRQRQRTATPDTPSPYALINDPVAFQKWFVKQDSAFQKYMSDNDVSHQDVLKKQWDRYNELQKTVVPEGMQVDPALLGTPKAVGKGVVLGAVQTIEKLFPDGQGGQFMVNVAAAESNFGAAANTFRTSGDRGMWQVNDGPTGALTEVQRRAAMPGDPMAAAAAKAKAALGIDIATLTSSDLDKPLVSALVSRVYFMRSQAPIPSDPQAQAEYWRENYNPRADDGMVANFVAAANSLLVTPAYASTGAEAGGPGLVTDMGGNAFPANFTALQPFAQTSAQRLSASFGQTLRITPHGGTQADARSSTSQHHKGTAIDIYVADMSDADKTRLIAIAIQMGYRGIGGYGAGDGKGTIHLDLRRTGRHGGLALWWRHRPGKDSDWATGEKWFVEGVKQGSALKGLDLG